MLPPAQQIPCPLVILLLFCLLTIAQIGTVKCDALSLVTCLPTNGPSFHSPVHASDNREENLLRPYAEMSLTPSCPEMSVRLSISNPLPENN
jgi:hypothetical protein